MEKKKIELIITIGLIPILIFILSQNILGTQKKGISVDKDKAMPKASEKAALETQAAGGKDLKTEEIERIKSLDWKRDPFVLGQVYLAAGGLTLNGVVWDEKSPSAIINNRIVRIGDQIEGHKVVDIQKTKVILTKDAAAYELNLLGGSRK